MSNFQQTFAPSSGRDAYDQPLAQPYGIGMCLLIGLTVAIPIAPETRLTVFDGVALLLIMRAWHNAMRLFRPALLMLAISGIAMTVSAYLNGSGTIPLLGRGYQVIVLFVEAMGYGVLMVEVDNKRRAALVLGVAAGICCHYFYPVDARVLGEPIKFLIGIPLGVGLLAAYALVQPRAGASTLLIVGLMLVYAIFCFVVGSRSIGGVFFVSALIVAGIGWLHIPRNYKAIAPIVIIVAALLVYALTEAYTALALQGVFGSRAAGIAAFQSSYGSILLGGRPEVIVNLSGMRDAPVFGVGIGNYPSIYLYEMIQLSVYSQDTVFDVDNILYHSALFGTAFESGMIAALVWAYVLYMALLAVPLLKNLGTGQRAFVAPLLLMTSWHVLYSPPIPYNRFVMGIGFAFAIVIYDEWRRAQAASYEDRSFDEDMPFSADDPDRNPHRP